MFLQVLQCNLPEFAKPLKRIAWVTVWSYKWPEAQGSVGRHSLTDFDLWNQTRCHGLISNQINPHHLSLASLSAAPASPLHQTVTDFAVKWRRTEFSSQHRERTLMGDLEKKKNLSSNSWVVWLDFLWTECKIRLSDQSRHHTELARTDEIGMDAVRSGKGSTLEKTKQKLRTAVKVRFKVVRVGW